MRNLGKTLREISMQKWKPEIKIPTVLIPSALFSWSGYLMTILTGYTPKRVRKKHQMLNENALSTNPKRYFGYIENQNEWGNIRFGAHPKSKMKHSGCGIIALWNAFHALNRYPNHLNRTDEAKKMSALITDFEKHGSMLSGGFGISQVALYLYLERNGYHAKAYYTANAHRLDKIGEQHTCFIVTVYNDKSNLLRGLHHVCVTKGSGKFVAHNIYRKNARGKYICGKQCETLSEAIKTIGSSVRPVMLTVIN